MWSADRHVMDVFSIDTLPLPVMTIPYRKRADLVIPTFFAVVRRRATRLAGQQTIDPPAVGLPHFPFIQSLTILGNTVFYTKNMQCY